MSETNTPAQDITKELKEFQQQLKESIRIFEQKTGMHVKGIQLHREEAVIAGGRKVHVNLKVSTHIGFPE